MGKQNRLIMKTKLIIIGLAVAIRVQADTNFFNFLTCGDTTYTNATINHVTPSYATVTFAGGIVQVPLRDLPENLQQQYHYNSNAAVKFVLEQKEKSQQLRAAEAARQAAAARRVADEAATAAQIARSPAGLDAEAKKLAEQGYIEVNAQLLENFPEKTDLKTGWMDCKFSELTSTYSEYPDLYLGFSVWDKNGDTLGKCIVGKKVHGNPDGDPNPLVPEISNLKRGDKIRLIGRRSYLSLNDSFNNRWIFSVEKIEMIETAAENKAREQAAENP
jgi:hypothetical protein